MSAEQTEAIEIVMRFFAALDGRQHEAAAELMAPAGVWLRQGVELVGPQAVLEALDRRPKNRVTCHVVSNVRLLHGGSDQVELRYYLSAYEAYSDGESTLQPRLAAILESTDELVRTQAGWRINRKSSRRHIPPG